MSYTLTTNRDFIVIDFVGETSLEENELVRQLAISEINDKCISAVLVDMTKADLSDVQLEPRNRS